MMGVERSHDNEKLGHEVTLADFEIGVYPVTHQLWHIVMQDTDFAEFSYFKGDRYPLRQASWEDTQVFLQRLNAVPEIQAQNDQDNRTFRLPSEAQWEYAARGGQKSQGFTFAGSCRLEEVGWFHKNSHFAAKPVGLKLPNELGLYDMSGNIWEWCAGYDQELDPRANRPDYAWVDEESYYLNQAYFRGLCGGSTHEGVSRCTVFASISWDLAERGKEFGFRLARY